jgi:hypothetical protein
VPPSLGSSNTRGDEEHPAPSDAPTINQTTKFAPERIIPPLP